MDYDVKFVEYKGGNIKVSYTVTPLNSHEEASIISRIDKPHEDFMRAWMELPEIARRLLEFPLANEDGEELGIMVTKVNFLTSKNFGRGMQLVALLLGFKNCKQPLQVVTQKFYENAVDHSKRYTDEPFPLQQLMPQVAAVMQMLKKEAFDYAYHCKREQPTIDEAQDAYKNGGYPDEEE